MRNSRNLIGKYLESKKISKKWFSKSEIDAGKLFLNRGRCAYNPGAVKYNVENDIEEPSICNNQGNMVSQ